MDYARYAVIVTLIPWERGVEVDHFDASSLHHRAPVDGLGL
jgi:hypothetical protein